MNSLRGMNVSKEMIIETAVTAETLDANVKGLHGPSERDNWQASHKQACGGRRRGRGGDG